MKTGTIIFLNGTSSSGKSTLVKELQSNLMDPFLEMGLDKFIWMLPKRYLEEPLWDEVLGKADTAGALGHQLVYTMHRTILTAAYAGFNILADHVLVEPNWALDCAEVFHNFNTYLIGIRCSLEILENRERMRKDRTWGQARLQYNRVHAHNFYDFEVDTGEITPDKSADQILDFLSKNFPPRALKQLHQSNKNQI